MTGCCDGCLKIRQTFQSRQDMAPHLELIWHLCEDCIEDDKRRGRIEANLLQYVAWAGLTMEQS